MYVYPAIAIAVPLITAAIGFTIAALLGAAALDKRERELQARYRHPAGKQQQPFLRSVPIEWQDAL